MTEIGDYAIASNLSYAVAVSENKEAPSMIDWVIEAKERWGEQFIGIYYYDDPGGDMLDGSVGFEEFKSETDSKIISFGKNPWGISITYSDETSIAWLPDGEIIYYFQSFPQGDVKYYVNETIVARILVLRRFVGVSLDDVW